MMSNEKAGAMAAAIANIIKNFQDEGGCIVCEAGGCFDCCFGNPSTYFKFKTLQFNPKTGEKLNPPQEITE